MIPLGASATATANHPLRLLRLAAGLWLLSLLSACIDSAAVDSSIVDSSSAESSVAASSSTDSPNPLLVSVCRNDFAAVAELAPPDFGSDDITTARGLTALDLALANGHWEVATLLLYSGAQATHRTLTLACDIGHAKTLCARDAKWRHHASCRAVEEPSRWRKTCRAPERNCRRILGDAGENPTADD
ncbi:MAG: hypothetical protein ACR2P7_05410 [bacterium]